MSKIDFILADTTDQALQKGLDLVMQKAQTNPFQDYVVLVPDTKTMMTEKYLLSICKAKAFANIYIYSLSRLLNKISPVSKELVLSKQASIMIVRKIILENQNNLVCYKKTALTNGFAEVVFGTISQLKSSNISASDFYDMIEDTAPSLKIKMQDIALIYDEYQKYIENRYFDQSDLLTVLAETSSNSEFVKNAEFFYLGFESITAEAIAVCTQIIKTCKHFVVGASYLSETVNSHIADNEIFNKFKAVADTFNYDYVPQRIVFNYSKTFKHIKENLYAYPPKVMAEKCDIQILSASNIQNEVEFVAQKISELVRGGQRYNQIAVVCTNLESYQEKIQKIFAEYDFSFFVAKPYDYASHPLFNLIKSYLLAVRKNFEKSAVIEFLSNTLLGQTDKIANFINYVEQYGLDHGDFKKPFERFDENIITKEELAELENLRNALVHYVTIFNTKTSKVRDFNTCLREFLQKIDIDKKLEILAESQQQDKIHQSITKQAKEKLEAVLLSMDNFLAEEQMPVEMYQSLLSSGLVASDVSVLPVAQDAIIVSNNSDGLLNIKSLFVLGATEGAFPVKQQDCGMILDEEIKSLGEKSQKTIEPTIKTINRRERQKAFETLLLPTEKLFLSYFDGAGENANKPSNIIDQLIYMFGGKQNLPVQKFAEESELANVSIQAIASSKQNLAKFVCAQIGEKKAYGNFSNPALANAAYYAIKEDLAGNLKTKIKNINNQEEYKLENADKLFFANKKTSISQLEKYFTCPFLFFATYGLRLKENPSSKMQAMDVGNVLHKVAELFVAKFAKNTQIDIENTAKSIAKSIILQEYNVERNQFLTKIVEDEAVRLCKNLADEQLHSHFKPIGLEETFGENGKLKGIDLSCGISLEGKIDRIDACGDRFRIIDYKTGKVEDNIKRVFYGKKIQLISYLMAMEQSGLKPAGVVYYPIRNEFSDTENSGNKMKGFFVDNVDILKQMDTTLSEENQQSTYLSVKLNKPNKKTGEVSVHAGPNILSDKDFENTKEYCVKLSKNAVEEILSGYISPSPIKLFETDRLPCQTCPYYGVCGVQKTKYANGRKCYGTIKVEDLEDAGGTN